MQVFLLFFCKNTGVDVLVSGSYVFKSTDPYATIHALKELH